jgi:hypothetical protein
VRAGPLDIAPQYSVTAQLANGFAAGYKLRGCGIRRRRLSFDCAFAATKIRYKAGHSNSLRILRRAAMLAV